MKNFNNLIITLVKELRFKRSNSKFFFLILLFGLIGKTSMSQCNPLYTSSFPILTACDGPIDLSAYVNGLGDHFTSPTSGAYLIGNYFYPALSTGSGTYSIVYSGASTCTPFIPIVNQNITVSSTNTLKILSNGADLTKYTYTPSVGCTLTVANAAIYNSFIWYKNGFEIANCSSCSTLVVNDMGTYTLKAHASICNLDFQDEVEIACDCNYSGATVIGSSGMTVYLTSDLTGTSGGLGFSGIDFVLEGTVVIPAGLSIQFNAANIKMMPCSKIVIEAGTIGNPGGTLTTIRSTITGCDKWQGIIINGFPTHDHTYNEHGKFFSSDGLEISDAYKAIYSDNGGKVEIILADFENNENDITLQNYGYDYSTRLNSLNFKGKWMHNDIASFCSLYSYATPINPVEKNMIYLEDIQDIDLFSCSFNGNDFLDGSNNYVTNGIEIYNARNINLGRENPGSANNPLTFTGYLNTGITARSLTNVINSSPYYVQDVNYMFDKYYFDADVKLYKGIVLDNCSTVTLGYVQSAPFDANRFLGKMEYGTYVTNSYNILQYENLFNVSNVGSTSTMGSNISQCAYYSASDNLNFASNIIVDIPFGVDFESNTNSNIHGNILQTLRDGFLFKSCDDFSIQDNTMNGCTNAIIQFYGSGGTNSVISGNRFINGVYGLIVSPSFNPIGASGGSNLGTVNMDIECNLFRNNDYSIVGSGDIRDQGNSTTANGNEFDNNYKRWDLVWEDSNSPIFTFYGSTVSGSLPNTDPTLTYSPSIVLNGNTFSSSSSDFNTVSTAFDPACFNTLLISHPTHTIQEYSKKPVVQYQEKQNEMIIKTDNTTEMPNTVLCYDALGRSYSLTLISFENGIYKFDTKFLSSGIYYISINNISLKFYKTN